MRFLNFERWIKISLYSLLVIALLGLLMRYKILFELPFLDQKNIQHAHSHFAFAGWVSQFIMILMVYTLKSKIPLDSLLKYQKIFTVNLVVAYLMLISFLYQGYGLFSISLSTLSILVSYWFAYWFYQDLKIIPNSFYGKNWFKAALLFLVASSVGTFCLAYMMATKNLPQDFYLGSIYFYLHFQYNGWFWFAIVGLFMSIISENITIQTFNQKAFRLFFWSCIPAYFLSMLWIDLPIYLYGITVLGALAQVWGWWYISKAGAGFIKNISHEKIFLVRAFQVIYLCVWIKLILQLASVIPAMSQIAFGFRPIVVAYLHLVLLIITSGFLLFFAFCNNLIKRNKATLFFLGIFGIGIFLNEIILGTQGILSVKYILLPYVNQLLFTATIIIVLGISGMVIFNRKKTKKALLYDCNHKQNSKD